MQAGYHRMHQDLSGCSRLEEVMESLLALLNTAFNGNSCTLELPSRLVDGHERYVSIRLHPMMHDEQITGVNIQIEDHEDRILHRKRLLQTSRCLRSIAQIHAHQLRGPLSTVMTLLAMAEAPEVTDDDRREIIHQLSLSSTEVDPFLHHMAERSQMPYE